MNKICAIIVTFNIGEKFLENYLTVENQVEKIIIIDNNSNKETKKVLNEIELKNPRVKVIYNLENFGLAKAQNIGLEYIKKYKYDWILLLDNDTKLSLNYTINMLREYEALDNKEHVGMLVPNVKELQIEKENKFIIYKNGVIKRKKMKEKILSDILVAIASGSLIKVEVLNKIGFMKEDFFIDFIDIEFSLRMNSLEYKIIGIKNAEIYHNLGNRTRKLVYLNNHSPIRRYYLYRNRIKVWKEYFKDFPIYVIYEFFVSIIEFIKIICLEKSKKENFINIIRGIKDGVK